MHLSFNKRPNGKIAVKILESYRDPARGMKPRKRYLAQVGSFLELRSGTGKLDFWLRLNGTMNRLGLSDMEKNRIKASARRRVKSPGALPLMP